VVQEPIPELRRLATRLDYGLGQYLAARGPAGLNTKWEAPRYAWTLSNSVLRHAEATITLAKSDMVLAAPAWATARAAVETAVRCLWLLRPEDEWEREARWLALLNEGARLGTARKEMASRHSVVARSTSIKEFSDAVTALLPPGIRVPGTPTTASMLEDAGKHLPAFYALASQYTHGAELAATLTRKNLGTQAIYGEFSSAADWCEPLITSYKSFCATAVCLMDFSEVEAPPTLSVADRQIEDGYRSLVIASSPG
jgi:hypothetical protein